MKQDKLKLKGEKNLVKAIQRLVNMPDGGFIPNLMYQPQESTFVQPRSFQQLGNLNQVQMSPEIMGQRINELGMQFLSPTGNKYHDDSVGSSFKSKAPRTHFREKSLGGNLLSTAASFIPGVGPILAPLIGLGDQMMNQPKTVPEQQLMEQQPNNNIYGNFAKGGFVNEGFKQYSTGTHASGNDQPIDQHGNTNSNAVASVQGKENSFMIDGKPFIMSDTLSNPATGNTFNVDAMKVNKQYKQAAYLPEDKNALNFTMKKLAKLNTAMKSLTETSSQMAAGGYVGGPDDPNNPVRNKPWVDTFGVVHKPDNQYSVENIPNNDLNVPLATDPFNIKTNTDYLPGNYTTDDGGSLATDSTTFGTELVSPTPTSNTSSYAGKGSVGDRGLTSTVGNNVLDSGGANAIALGLKGAGLLKSVFDAARPAEVEQPILPNYNKSDAYIKSANIDYTQAKQDALGISNIAGNTNRSLSTNAAQFQGREQARLANLQDAVGGISQQENNGRSALNMQRGQYEQGKALDTANRLSQNRIDNQMNAANSRFAGEKLFSELSSIGTEFNQYAETQKEIQNNKELQSYYVNEGLALLNAKTPDFQLDPEIVTKLQSGKYTLDDLVKVKIQVDKVKKGGTNG